MLGGQVGPRARDSNSVLQNPCSLCPRHRALGPPGCPHSPSSLAGLSARGGLFPGCPGGRGRLWGVGGPFSGSGPPCEISVVWSGLLSCPTARPSTRALSESSWEAKNRGISAGQGLCLPLGFPGNAGLWPAFSPPQLSGRAGVQLRVPTRAPVRSVTTSPPAPSAPGPGWQLGRDTVWDQAGAEGEHRPGATGTLTPGLAS